MLLIECQQVEALPTEQTDVLKCCEFPRCDKTVGLGHQASGWQNANQLLGAELFFLGMDCTVGHFRRPRPNQLNQDQSFCTFRSCQGWSLQIGLPVDEITLASSVGLVKVPEMRALSQFLFKAISAPPNWEGFGTAPTPGSNHGGGVGGVGSCCTSLFRRFLSPGQSLVSCCVDALERTGESRTVDNRGYHLDPFSTLQLLRLLCCYFLQKNLAGHSGSRLLHVAALRACQKAIQNSFHCNCPTHTAQPLQWT